MARVITLTLVVFNVLMLSGCTPAVYTPLQRVVISNDIISVRRFIDAGADVNEKGMGDYTALHYAAQLGNTEMAKLFIEKGANVNSLAVDHSTPLMMAVQTGQNTDMARLLIANGANVSLKKTSGQTALDLATGDVRAILISYNEPTNKNISSLQPIMALQQKVEEPAQPNITVLKTLISNKDMKGLLAYLDLNPEALSAIEDDHLRLLCTGPAKLRIIDIEKLVKNKKKDSIIIAKINSTSGLYKDFTDDEMTDLKKMDISDEVVAAMIAATAEYHKEQKRHQVSQAPAQIVQQQAQPVAQQQAPESNSLSECVKLAAALKACDYSGLFSMPCKAVARSQFNCPTL